MGTWSRTLSMTTATEIPSGVLAPAIEEMLRLQNDHWHFFQFVKTLDQADKYNPVKSYPVDKEYLKWLSTRIVHEPLLAIVKHRRMIITWTCCAVATWDAMMHEGRMNAMLSKKEEHADDLVQRCKFIYDNIPDSAFPVPKPRAEYKYTELLFPEIDSKIKGFPQGAEQLRQFTCSRIFADEIAFWNRARETFTAMKPTIEGGGQITLLSTRFPGFFKDLVEDRLD